MCNYEEMKISEKYLVKDPSKMYGCKNHSCEKIQDRVEMILNIKENYEKMKLLHVLQNNHTSIETKLTTVENIHFLFSNKSKFIPNIYSGGLMNDWK